MAQVISPPLYDAGEDDFINSAGFEAAVQVGENFSNGAE
jgi:hypothetical protein